MQACIRGLCLFALVLLSENELVPAAISTVGFPPAQWQTSDASLGIGNLAIENFEDLALAPGLQVEVRVPGFGGFGPASTLPNTFDPRPVFLGGNDPVGNLFEPGLWDGQHLLINYADNRVNPGQPLSRGDVTFYFAPPVTRFGVSLMNNEFDAGIVVNGALVGNTGSLLPLGPNRNGYLRIDATGSDQITSVRFDNGVVNGVTDGIAFDHVAYQPVDEPPSWLLLGIGIVSALDRASCVVTSNWYCVTPPHKGWMSLIFWRSQ